MGVHPYRQWCHQTAHQDTGKCPIHVAAERGQLLILKLFTTKNLWTLACRDPAGRDPLNIAIQHGHRDCVRYLANKLCSVVSLPNMSLPMRLYLQLKHWMSLGQKRVASNQCQYINDPFQAQLGDMLLVDGFNQPHMSSKSKKTETKPRRGIRAKALQPLPPIAKQAQPHLPSMQSVNPSDFKETQKMWKQDIRHRSDGPLENTKKSDSKFTLPPVTGENILKPVRLDAFCQHRGRTPRENAIYCLSIARCLQFFLYMYM